MLVYKITNTVNSKCYVGQTIRDLDVRWKQHIYDAANERYYSKFHNSIRKYGSECWKIEVLEKVEDVNLLNEREMYWVNYFDSFNKGYNSTSGGLQRTVVSEETREKQRKANILLGKKPPIRNKPHSEATKEKIRLGKLGKKTTRCIVKKQEKESNYKWKLSLL